MGQSWGWGTECRAGGGSYVGLSCRSNGTNRSGGKNILVCDSEMEDQYIQEKAMTSSGPEGIQRQGGVDYSLALWSSNHPAGTKIFLKRHLYNSFDYQTMKTMGPVKWEFSQECHAGRKKEKTEDWCQPEGVFIYGKRDASQCWQLIRPPCQRGQRAHDNHEQGHTLTRTAELGMLLIYLH